MSVCGDASRGESFGGGGPTGGPSGVTNVVGAVLRGGVNRRLAPGPWPGVSGPAPAPVDDKWAMKLRWQDRGIWPEAIHRPALVAYNKADVPMKLELTKASKPRLRPTLFHHAVRVSGGVTGGVV